MEPANVSSNAQTLAAFPLAAYQPSDSRTRLILELLRVRPWEEFTVAQVFDLFIAAHPGVDEKNDWGIVAIRYILHRHKEAGRLNARYKDRVQYFCYAPGAVSYKRKNAFWTLERCLRLRELWIAGVQLKLIAEEFDRSISIIEAKASAMRLPRRQTPGKRGTHYRIYAPAEVFDALGKLAQAAGMSRSVYVGRILRAHLSEVGDQPTPNAQPTHNRDP